MWLDSSQGKPFVEWTERWASPLGPDAALKAAAQIFASDGAGVSQDGNSLEVRRGSNWQYRLWGNLFSVGRKNIPVGLTLTARTAAEGSEIEAHAFDTFGYRITEYLFFGARETFEEHLQSLVNTAAAAMEVDSRAVVADRKMPRNSHDSSQSHTGAGMPPGESAARTNPLAIASLVSSPFINLFGIILGHMALKEIKRTGEGGRGLAIAGLVIGYLSLVLGTIVIIFVFSTS